MYLTKSDFKVARTCPTKLYYKKLRYPSLLDDDPYMEFLADGGYMVETMAKLLHPEGREIGNWDKPEEAFAETQKALTGGNCTLFEATVIHGKLLARLDIVQRFGKTLRLIEVKSTSVDTVEDGENPFRGKRGAKLLLEDQQSSLGWRIILKSLLKKEDFESLLKRTHTEPPERFFDIVDAEIKKRVKRILTVLRHIKSGEQIDENKFNEEEVADILTKLGFQPNESTKALLKDEILSSFRPLGQASIRKIPIRARTIERSKGLAADYVFIAHSDDRLLINDPDKAKISDRDICKFLVALTRARKKVFLISSDLTKQPTFLTWINKDRIEQIDFRTCPPP